MGGAGEQWKNEKGDKIDRPSTRSSATDNAQELSLSTFLSPHVSEHYQEPKQDSALTAVINAYDHCMAEVQCQLIANQEQCLMELKAEYEGIVTGL